MKLKDSTRQELKDWIQESIKCFSNPLGLNLWSQIERINNKKASLVILDGGVGSGKTHAGVNIGDWLNKGLDGDFMDLKIQYATGGDDFEDKFSKCMKHKKKIIIYDEAGDFNRRGSITKFNQRLNRIFETYRTFEILVILILPTFAVLDNQLFINKIPRLLINCHNKVNDKYTRFRAYSLNRMFWLKHYFEKLVVKPQAYAIEKPNFRGIIRPLSKERALQVDKLSSDSKKEIFNVQKKGEFNKYDLGKLFNYPGNTIRTMLSVAKISPVRKNKNVNIWGEEAYNYFMNLPKFKKETKKGF